SSRQATQDGTLLASHSTSQRSGQLARHESLPEPSRALPWLKKTTVFEYRVAIGHAGDVVGDGACAARGAARLLAAARGIAILGRHEVDVSAERVEELREHAARLSGHAQHLVVAVHALIEKLLELEMFRAHLFA